MLAGGDTWPFHRLRTLHTWMVLADLDLAMTMKARHKVIEESKEDGG